MTLQQNTLEDALIGFELAIFLAWLIDHHSCLKEAVKSVKNLIR